MKRPFEKKRIVIYLSEGAHQIARLHAALAQDSVSQWIERCLNLIADFPPGEFTRGNLEQAIQESHDHFFNKVVNAGGMTRASGPASKADRERFLRSLQFRPGYDRRVEVMRMLSLLGRLTPYEHETFMMAMQEEEEKHQNGPLPEHSIEVPDEEEDLGLPKDEPGVMPDRFKPTDPVAFINNQPTPEMKQLAEMLVQRGKV